MNKIDLLQGGADTYARDTGLLRQRNAVSVIMGSQSLLYEV